MLSQYYSTETPESLLSLPGVLSVISFTSACREPADSGCVPTGVESLSGIEHEVLQVGKGSVERGVDGRCHWSRSDDIACTAVWISPEDCADIESATCVAYRELLGCVAGSAHPHLFRIWNFIPGINQGQGDEEEYRKFCTGRQQAFSEFGLKKSAYPAASALGHHSEGAVIFMLSSNHPGVCHENPVQESAYNYPRQYGPSSPSFSRATSISIGPDAWLFVSGTASILGHETQASGDFEAQLGITLDNIDRLLLQAGMGRIQSLNLRVYLRRQADMDAAKQLLGERFPEAGVNYCRADICRSDLLVEIEAAVRYAEPDAE